MTRFQLRGNDNKPFPLTAMIERCLQSGWAAYVNVPSAVHTGRFLQAEFQDLVCLCVKLHFITTVHLVAEISIGRGEILSK